MGIIKDTLNKQIQENNAQQFNDATATIIEYHYTSNTAKIRYLNPNGEGILYRDNVPIANTLGGLTGAGFHPGQSCSITFINNNIYSPLITGMIGSNYSNKTNGDQGAYLIDTSILHQDKPVIIPMIESWIDSTNNNPAKYKNDLGDYTNIDVTKYVHELLNALNKYKPSEQGMTNLDTKSTVKLKENGDIDIFVSNNIGIRICPCNKTIEFYGLDFWFNGVSLKDFMIKEPEKDSINIGDIMKINSIIDLFKKIDDQVEELKLCIEYTSKTTGDDIRFLALQSKIKGYLTFKQDYYDDVNQNTLTPEDLNNVYNTLVSISEDFDKELFEARGILEVE